MNIIKLLFALTAAFALFAVSASASHDPSPPSGTHSLTSVTGSDANWAPATADQPLLLLCPAEFECHAFSFALGACYRYEPAFATHRLNKTGRICVIDIGETARSSC